MKYMLMLCCVITQLSFSQTNGKAENQEFLLWQYVGEWLNGDNINAKEVSKDPNTRILVTPKMDGVSFWVEVSQKKVNQWAVILTEMISYDANTNEIVALGTNPEAENFIGKGFFSSYDKLTMRDHDFKGDFVQEVRFHFEEDGRLLLTGDAPDDEYDWEGVFFKTKTHNKNFGIHLVSVDSEMRKDPLGTIDKIGKMGYSYVETHRYDNGKFYGLTPEQFHMVLEKNNLHLAGSMVFKDLDFDNPDQSMKWWDRCIEDHLKIKVSYLTTTNINLELLKQEDGLKRYASYFNKIGRKCNANGLKFLYHNHTDEFKKIGNQIIYDYLLDHTDPEVVYFQSDLFWMYTAKVDPVYYFEKYPSRFLSWHVKDIKELGASGKIDFKRLFSFASVAGLQYNTVEIENYDYPPLISARMASDYIRYKRFINNYD
ncbi:TIM barrel protein [Aquimarina sp. D1M17]|uniref:sugar phosphate isomerase/epimerase family protein n=1 Tax=Aquimarina acroporae TaxID=2937283 RepID=UPI0020C09D01|nr:TIM barrel protein [Aquimarina acroporae]MCK8521769.1 TIM barrel protein [Aquimarina acroporae]